MRRRVLLAGGLGLAGAAAASHHFGAPATGGPLFVRRSGSGGPRILCLHGLFASGAFWTRLATSLGTGYRLVMPDLVGFGKSPQPEADYTEDFHLDWIAPLLEEWEEWTVLGHSMGCALALAAARRWPDRIRRSVSEARGFCQASRVVAGGQPLPSAPRIAPRHVAPRSAS